MHTLRICFCWVVFALAACPSAAVEKDKDVLAVRIVPTSFRDDGGRILALFGPAQHFYVVVTNVGTKTVRLWKDQCSWGYGNLSFESKAPDGKVQKVTKKPRAWDKNVPDWIGLLPGDHLVLEVTFDPTVWHNAPVPAAGQQRSLELKAVFEIADDSHAKQDQVWTGRVSSPENRYTIFR